jgi:hypothetical protein
MEDFVKKYFILVFMILSVYSIFGQEKIIPISINYFGETFSNPGIEIGYENTFYKGFNFTASIGTYIHQRNHVGLFLCSGLNWRHTFPIGYSMEFGLALGYLHTWAHGGKIYTVDNNGNISEKPNYGRPHFMPMVKLGLLGWDFRKKANIPLRLNADIVGFGQYPFNTYLLPHIAVKIGGTYYFTF